MRDLRTLREIGAAMNQAESELPCDLSIEEGVKIFASLYEAVKTQLAETWEIFRPVREAEILELQARLRRLDEWRRQNGANREFTQAAGACAEAA